MICCGLEAAIDIEQWTLYWRSTAGKPDYCTVIEIASVTAMFAELNLQTLAERRRIARLTMFHKIHYRLVAVDMPLQSKQYTSPTRTENALAYPLPTSACEYHLFSFFPKTGRDWNSLPQEVVQLNTPGAFRSACPSTYLTVTTPVQPSARVFNTEVGT